MNTSQAKKEVAEIIKSAGLPPHRLTAKNISFTDLARAEYERLKVKYGTTS